MPTLSFKRQHNMQKSILDSTIDYVKSFQGRCIAVIFVDNLIKSCWKGSGLADVSELHAKFFYLEFSFPEIVVDSLQQEVLSEYLDAHCFTTYMVHSLYILRYTAQTKTSYANYRYSDATL